MIINDTNACQHQPEEGIPFPILKFFSSTSQQSLKPLISFLSLDFLWIL